MAPARLLGWGAVIDGLPPQKLRETLRSESPGVSAEVVGLHE